MDFLEKDLEQIVFEQLKSLDGCKKLRSLGLPVAYNPFVFRQPRIGDYGVADIVSFNREHKLITIYELKNKSIDMRTLLQAGRYLKGIKRFIEHRGYNSCDYSIDIVLIGRYLSTDDWVYLFDGIVENTHVFTYDYSISGIKFNNAAPYNYKLTKENFNG